MINCSAFAVLSMVTLIRIQGASSCPVAEICSQLNGVMNGGRCFFIINANTSWANAWTACQTAGGTLAQIHSASEYNAITSLGRGHFGLWIAMQRDRSLIGNVSCSNAQNESYWYDSATVPNTTMKAANTWMTNHICDESDYGPTEFCLLVYTGEFPSTFIADVGCDRQGVNPLCMFNSMNQDYTLARSCMGGAPLETITVGELIDCANACTDRMWCRSFNLVAFDQTTCTSLTCQLFLWSSVDNNATMIPVTGECIHYDYVP